MPTTYSEKLRVPLRWWVWATMLLSTFWLAFIVAVPEWIAWSGTGVLVASTYGLFLWVGSSRIEVRDGVLHVGPAHIELRHLGAVEPLDKEAMRLVHGRDADVRAFLHTRPYLSRGVKIAIADPADPTPYWLVSTRHPRTLAAALTALDNVR